MHPINNMNFGVGKVKVYFYDGSALTTGYVVKQIGTQRYVVSNGTVTKTVSLAPTAALAQRLDGTVALGTASEIASLCTMRISVASVAKYVFKLTDAVAVTDGGVYSWALSGATGTIYAIDLHVTAIANTALPVISGTAKVGQVLTASNGAWSGSPSSFVFQWSAGGVVISGATTNTYTPVTGDIGKVITCAVTAKKTGTADVIATSAATAAVVA